jgi:membrane protease YdiL (CAAX protease family)
MREWVRGLSWRVEFAIVMIGAFGLPLIGTVLVFVDPERWLRGAPLLTNARLLRTVIFELGVGSILWRVLTWRGWTRERVGLVERYPRVRALGATPVAALGLLVASYATYALLLFLAEYLSPGFVRNAAARRLVAPHLPMATVIVGSLVNPVFEEVFVCGYVISALRERLGASTAVNVSAAIRVAYHLYQGIIGVLSITPFALIGATWFARTRRLIPLVLAHALIDFAGLWFGSR